MPYSPHRRTPPVPKLNPVTRNEAAETSDLERQKAYERAREEIADDLRRQREGTTKKSFADLLKKK